MTLWILLGLVGYLASVVSILWAVVSAVGGLDDDDSGEAALVLFACAFWPLTIAYVVLDGRLDKGWLARLLNRAFVPKKGK